jgi:hypothetical protein
MTILLMLLLDLGIARPHLEHAHYGHVIFAAALLAPLLMLPQQVWPTPGQLPPQEPPKAVRRGALWLLMLPVLYVLALATDRGFEWLDPEPTDSRLSAFQVFSMLLTILAARWAATGTWLVTTPVLSRWPRTRRGAAALAVLALMMFLHDGRSLPIALAAAGDFAGIGMAAGAPDEECATVTTHASHGVMLLDGAICNDTLDAFEAEHRMHPTIRRIVLDSHGGRLATALAIGERLEELGFEARVDGQCSSACVTIFVGAQHRYVGPEGWIAVHQGSATVWAEGKQWVRWPLPPNERSESFHAQRGVSPDLAGRVAETPPDSLDLLSNEDLVAYGIAEPTVDDPWLPPSAANDDSEESEEIQP